MDFTLEGLTVLAGIPAVLVLVYNSWLLKLKRDLKVGRRERKKWKDLSLLKKLYGVALVCYFVFVLYYDLSTLIPVMTGSGAQFITLLQDAVIAIWLGTAGFLGVGLFYSLRSPVQKPAV